MNTNHSETKKRRIQNACLRCRQKKVRCDSGIMPDNICSGCMNAGADCTHNNMKKVTSTTIFYLLPPSGDNASYYLIRNEARSLFQRTESKKTSKLLNLSSPVYCQSQRITQYPQIRTIFAL
ncbi:MAG: hypothetical protein NXY57DRAFT_121318 [Lentinula lateritia]|nr:MAG: hypothetical protein NXY57DRAFT_121318 [Lentinula lateritia]